jgi:hypothetical protein
MDDLRTHVMGATLTAGFHKSKIDFFPIEHQPGINF